MVLPSSCRAECSPKFTLREPPVIYGDVQRHDIHSPRIPSADEMVTLLQRRAP